jgi:hypothetical protein
MDQFQLRVQKCNTSCNIARQVQYCRALGQNQPVYQDIARVLQADPSPFLTMHLDLIAGPNSLDIRAADQALTELPAENLDAIGVIRRQVYQHPEFRAPPHDLLDRLEHVFVGRHPERFLIIRHTRNAQSFMNTQAQPPGHSPPIRFHLAEYELIVYMNPFRDDAVKRDPEARKAAIARQNIPRTGQEIGVQAPAKM